MTALATLLLASLLGASLDHGTAVELRYRGVLTPIKRGETSEAVKEFSVYAVVRQEAPGGHRLAFVVDETGGGGWAWPERFGSMSFDNNNRVTSDSQMQVLYEYEGTPYPLPLHQPLFAHANMLVAGAQWEDDESDYEVMGERTIANRKCWGVEARDRVGRIRTVWVDQTTPVVIASEREVVVGRGERLHLEMELESSQELSDQELETLDRPLQILLGIQKDLKRQSGATNPDLNDRQLAAVKPKLDNLREQAKSTPFEGLATYIRADVTSQLKRAESVTGVAQKLVGQPAPQMELVALDGTAFDKQHAAGAIEVLHFWKYRGDPPQEPYGQVGYLDFLYNRWKKQGVHVYGVAVSDRGAESGQRNAAVRQIRKLTEFMNLSYPIVIDDGTLLSKFGDPRRLGAKLPVWVVIGPDSKVAHYHTGFYEIARNEGLRELDEVLVELIKQRRAAKPSAPVGGAR